MLDSIFIICISMYDLYKLWKKNIFYTCQDGTQEDISGFYVLTLYGLELLCYYDR